jgi:cytoskeletal protein CcmA (bactofilin family)
MNRILGIVSAMLLGLLILVPVAAAADPFYEDGRVVVSVRGDITFPAGDVADSLVVVDGHATIAGDVRSVFVVNGTVDFVGSQSRDVVAIASKITLDGGSVITGDISTFNTTVDQAAGAVVQGRIKNGLDLARAALFIGPALFLIYLGFVIAAVAAALALAGLASRHVRSAERVLSGEPLTAFLAGLAGFVAIITAAILAMVTIVGIPLGLGILIGFLPVILFTGYLVAGIWIGEWVVRQVSRGSAPDRPYAAAIVGVVLLGVVSIVPGVGAIIGFLGFGAVVLLMWRTLRGGANEGSVGQPLVASSAS